MPTPKPVVEYFHLSGESIVRDYSKDELIQKNLDAELQAARQQAEADAAAAAQAAREAAEAKLAALGLTAEDLKALMS